MNPLELAFRSPALQKHEMYSLWFAEVTQVLEFYCKYFHTNVFTESRSLASFSKIALKNAYVHATGTFFRS